MLRKRLIIAIGTLALGVLGIISWFAWDYMFRQEHVFHGDPSVTHCPLHGDLLIEEHVPKVQGGMPTAPMPGSQREAELKEFPFAHTTSPSGCVWDPSMEGFRVLIRYCPTCRDARVRWKREHPEVAQTDD